MADYNAEWSKLNNVPLNTKWDAAGQRKYIDDLTAKNPGIYKTPDMTNVTTSTPTTTPAGLMTPLPAVDTFDSIYANKYGVAPQGEAGAAVPSVAAPRVSHAPSGRPDTSLYTVANLGRNDTVSQTATNFTGNEAYGTGTGPNGTYTFDDQARDRYGAANTNEWTANMANASPDTGAPSPWVDPMTEINRRLAERGLPPQTASGGATGGTGGTTPGLMSDQNTVAPVDGQVGYEARQLANPTKWNVDDNQTVAGQVRNLIAENSPLQQLAETRAKQQMNQSGLMNSSMAVQAGQAAMYDAALPIAQADAGTYGRAAAYNADTENQFAGKNVDASNTAYNATANIRANTARDTAATIAQANLADKQGNIAASAAAKLAETNTAAAVLKAQNDISVAAAGALNAQALETLRGNITKAGIGQEQSIQISRDLTANINQIQSRTDINGDVKTQYINDAVARTNENLKLIHAASGLVGPLLIFGNTAPATPEPPVASKSDGLMTPPPSNQQFTPNQNNGIPKD